MSSHSNSYYGPYLVYRPSFQMVERTIWGCAKCDKENSNRSQAYCPTCGSALVSFNKEVQWEIQITEWTNERLYSPCSISEWNIAIPNWNADVSALKDKGGYTHDEDRENSSSREGWGNPTAVIEEFERIFEIEIGKLNEWKCFPCVRFGLVRYYS